MKNLAFGFGFVVLITMFQILSLESGARIDPNLVMGMWLFDEERGDTVFDRSGRGFDGKFVNDVKWTNGKFGKAVVITGESLINHGPIQELNVGRENFSLSAWIKVSDEPPDWHATIIHKAIWQAPRHGYVLCVRGKLDPNNVGKPLLWVGLGTEHGVHLFGTSKINDGKWHHLIGTVDRSSSMRLYVDGELNAELKITDYIKENEDNASNFYIGGEQGRPHAIERTIDEVAVFKTILSESEVKSIYEFGLERALGLTTVMANGKYAVTWGKLKSSILNAEIPNER